MTILGATLVTVPDDQVQTANLEDISPLISIQLSMKTGAQITPIFSFWKLFEPRPSVSPLPPGVALETLAEAQGGETLVSSYVGPPPLVLVVRWISDKTRGEKRAHEGSMLHKTKRARLTDGAPSYVSKPPMYRSWHDKDGPLIDHRHDYDRNESRGDKPPHSHYPPISLQYKGFGLFLDIFRGREDVPGVEKVPSRTLRRAVDDFADDMSCIFADELPRRTVGLDPLNEILATHTDQLPFRLVPADIDQSKSDGYFLGPHKVASCIVEFQNERGVGTSMTYVEMTSYFGHSIAQAMIQHTPLIMEGWNVPCLGITVDGFCVTLYVMLFVGDGRWRVVSLTPGLSCIQAAGEGDDRNSLYKAFTAACVLLSHIHEEATQVVANPPPPIEKGRRALPYISSLYRPGSCSRVEFKIEKPVSPDLDVTRRLLYLAKTTKGETIIVKFTRRYSYDLHMFCAERHFAPTFLGFESLPGGFFGIAMEFIDSFSQISHFEKSVNTGRWATNLQALVDSFHAQNLVHGDLRSPNILSDGMEVMIIDFDWGGKEGEVAYPSVELTSDLTYGRGSVDLKITKDDDLRVLCKTFRNLGQECNYCRAWLGLTEAR